MDLPQNKRLNTFKSRRIRFEEHYRYKEWALKLYSITPYDRFPADILSAAKKFIPTVLPGEAVTPERYGLGFAIVHEGLDGNYILISWWQGENMLCHFVYGSTPEEPYIFKSIKDTGIIACVWELEVIFFERNAWIGTALSGDAAWVENYQSRFL